MFFLILFSFTDIKKLKRLIVFEISFNSLTSLPSRYAFILTSRIDLSQPFNKTTVSPLITSVFFSLFQLKHLEILDLAYNRLTFISSDIANLRYSMKSSND